jgi:hypothetical protein
LGAFVGHSNFEGHRGDFVRETSAVDSDHQAGSDTESLSMWCNRNRRNVSFVVDDHRAAVPSDVVVVVGNVIGATVTLT